MNTMKITKDNIEAVKAFSAEWDKTHQMPDDGNIAAWMIQNQIEYAQALDNYLSGKEEESK